MMDRSLDRSPDAAPQHDAIHARPTTRDATTTRVAPDPMTQPHLVIKRGHLGRYRFTLLTDNGRVSGEVKVDNNGITRAEQDVLAREEVRQLAATLGATTQADHLRS